MINYKDSITIEMKELEALRYCTSARVWRGKSSMKFVKLGNASHNRLIEEKQVQNQVVRCLGEYVDRVTVIRNDSTVWTIHLSNFDSVTPLNVEIV